MVPMFACGFVRSNFAFATVVSPSLFLRCCFPDFFLLG